LLFTGFALYATYKPATAVPAMAAASQPAE
jgi:hypothetical protein